MTLKVKTPKHLQRPGKPLPMEMTEVSTWFERDRAHVALWQLYRGSDGPERLHVIAEWWDEEVSEAVTDGFLKAKDWHGTAYEYARSVGLLPMIPAHYIAGSGEHGCLYDSCHVCRTYADAVETLAETFELGRTRRATLKRSGYLELNSARDGAAYAEITACDCSEPWTHDENMTEEDWND